jgi:lysophospholipase L1-like esterase
MTIATTPRLWGRYVAVGDSLSEGLDDRAADGSYRGWADRLAELLADEAYAQGRPFEYGNLAVRGRLMADIATRQVDDALALQPDLVSIWGGGNDCLRPRADIDGVSALLDEAVARIRATGADVLMSTTTYVKGAPFVSLAHPKAAELTANIYTIAARHDCYVTDVWGLRALRDWRMWADDRIHMSSLGHRLVSLRAYSALGRPVAAEEFDPLPAQAAQPWRERADGHVRWAREHLAPWVARRVRGTSSGDGLNGKRRVPGGS